MTDPPQRSEDGVCHRPEVGDTVTRNLFTVLPFSGIFPAPKGINSFLAAHVNPGFMDYGHEQWKPRRVSSEVGQTHEASFCVMTSILVVNVQRSTFSSQNLVAP